MAWSHDKSRATACLAAAASTIDNPPQHDTRPERVKLSNERSVAPSGPLPVAPPVAPGRLLPLAFAAALVTTACQVPPTAAPAPEPSRPAPAPAMPAAPAPVTPPAPAPEPPPANPANAQRLVANAIELLEGGNDEQATVELQRALQADPNHRLAQSLLRQITADPLATLGRESFIYRVQPGESLSRIAQRFLGDVHLFYLLARYNDIKVPKQLAGGQLIRIPGRAQPPAPATPVPPPTPAAPATPTPAPADAARAEREKAERERTQAIARATRAARAAFARQDLDTAIQQWDKVLELDPNNATARLERQKAVELKERLGRVR